MFSSLFSKDYICEGVGCYAGHTKFEISTKIITHSIFRNLYPARTAFSSNKRFCLVITIVFSLHNRCMCLSSVTTNTKQSHQQILLFLKSVVMSYLFISKVTLLKHTFSTNICEL